MEEKIDIFFAIIKNSISFSEDRFHIICSPI